ncbi:methyltransferase domain-containing protein [Bacteroidota bacterium]
MYYNKKTYKWLYDHLHSKYYDLLMKQCYLPFGGEIKCRKILLEHLEFHHHEIILDMCCGTGGTTFIIAEKADTDSEIIGIDISTGQLNKARKKNIYKNVLFTKGNASHTKFTDNFFHKVFISFALHEMKREERLAVLSEAKRILLNNGKIIINEIDKPSSLTIRLFTWLWFYYWLPLNPETPTRKGMLKYGITNEVEESGFKNILKFNYFKEIFQTVIAGKKHKEENHT